VEKEFSEQSGVGDSDMERSRRGGLFLLGNACEAGLRGRRAGCCARGDGWTIPSTRRNVPAAGAGGCVGGGGRRGSAVGGVNYCIGDGRIAWGGRLGVRTLELREGVKSLAGASGVGGL